MEKVENFFRVYSWLSNRLHVLLDVSYEDLEYDTWYVNIDFEDDEMTVGVPYVEVEFKNGEYKRFTMKEVSEAMNADTDDGVTYR